MVRTRGKVAVLNPWPWGFPYGKHLDGEGLGEWGEASDTLQGGGGATVAQQRPSEGDVRLHGHQFVITIK